MNYQQALEWVHSLGRTHSTPDLNKMRNLMAALGNPQERLRFVHVAGTNGKGSTVTMLANILQCAGYKVGKTISPYIVDFRERFQINGVMIAELELAALLTEVREAADSLDEPTIEFAAATAAAFLFFARNNCDIVCMEAGIGGRHDATNIVENTLVACLTRIGLDHMELLGDTVEKIAEDKCDIIKQGCIVISYPEQPEEAKKVIKARTKELSCPLVVPQIADFHFYKGQAFENRFEYGGYNLELKLTGRHQALNASVALEAALALEQKGFKISDESIIEGLNKTQFPARIEVISIKPLILLDGAHNADGIKALAATLLKEKVEKINAVVGILQDKQAEKMLQMLAPYIDTLYAVRPEHPRAMPARGLAKMAQPMVHHAVVCNSINEAIDLAAGQPGGFMVCGSLYLASEARPILEKYRMRK